MPDARRLNDTYVPACHAAGHAAATHAAVRPCGRVPRPGGGPRGRLRSGMSPKRPRPSPPPASPAAPAAPAPSPTPAPPITALPTRDQLPAGYAAFFAEIAARVRAAQLRAAAAVNRELIALYWDLGREIVARQAREGWGAGVIARLSADLRREFP